MYIPEHGYEKITGLNYRTHRDNFVKFTHFFHNRVHTMTWHSQQHWLELFMKEGTIGTLVLVDLKSWLFTFLDLLVNSEVTNGPQYKAAFKQWAIDYNRVKVVQKTKISTKYIAVWMGHAKQTDRSTCRIYGHYGLQNIYCHLRTLCMLI